jgi:phytoene dehydrogenase-like protein
VLGGAAVSEQVFPGFTFSVCSYVVSLLRPEIIRDLELTRHGLRVLALDCTFTPFPDGESLARWGDAERTRREVSRLSRRDAEALSEFGRSVTEICRFIKPILGMTPPEVPGLTADDAARLYDMAKRFGELSVAGRTNLIRLMTMSAVDFLGQWFESERLVAPMSISGIIGTMQGVRSPSTAYVLLHHYMGEIDGAFRAWGLAKGGMGGVSGAIAAAARAAGAEIRTSAPVARVGVRRGRATGVVLEDGTELPARVVLSGLDPRRTFLGLVGADHLPGDFVEALGRYRYRGSSGKVNLALDRLPDFRARPGAGPHLMGDITIAPGLDYLEHAFDEAKYGRWSRRPFIDVVIPSLTDPSLAPPGRHVMSCFVQYAPYRLAEGDWDAQREAWADAVVATLEEYAPGLTNSILFRQALTPLDLERDFGLTEGNIFHGELSLEQLFFLRPVAGWGRFRTPVERLYLCASGAHPGGGVMGAPGRLAALRVLDDLKTRRIGR